MNKETYYSNCLVEAIKAKLKNRSLKIHMIPPALNEWHFHFYWKDPDEKRIYHFNALHGDTFLNRLNIFLFKGNIKSKRDYFFEEWLYHQMKLRGWSDKKQRRIAKKLEFDTLEPYEFIRVDD